MPESFPRIDAWVFCLDEPTTLPVLPQADADEIAQTAGSVQRIRKERSRAAMRSVLALRLGSRPEDVKIEIAAGGKPKTTGCEFSISHSGPWLVVAVSDVEVGVDIEMCRQRKNSMQLAERFFSKRDILSLRGVEPSRLDDAFLRQWVAKEAALKCAGVGLALHLHKAECHMDKLLVSSVRWDDEHFSIHEFTLPDGTPGAMAWRGDEKACIEWRDAAEANVS